MARAWDPQATDDARSRSDHTTGEFDTSDMSDMTDEFQSASLRSVNVLMHAADMDESTTYIAVMEGVWSVIDLYASRPDDRNPFDDADECPVQWPIPRNAQKKKTVHYCRCKVEWTINAEDPAWVRCGDTACIKSAGWHHKSCLTENEHDNLEQHRESI